MSQPSSIPVTVDNRVRLISTALAATNFPEIAQSRKRHHAHAHARATTKYLQERSVSQHPAIQGLQGLLDQGAPLEALYTVAMQWTWPGLSSNGLPRWVPDGWNQQMWDFYQVAELEGWWDRHSASWDSAELQARNAMNAVGFKEFLEPFVGEIQDDFVFMPNICYPADEEVGIRVGATLLSIVPPPLAWGHSPPWPYDEESMRAQHTYRSALGQYARLLMLAYLRANPEPVAEAAEAQLPVSEQFKAMYPAWEEQFVALFVAAAVAIYLQDYVSKSEADSYMLMEKRVRKLAILPGAVSVFRRYLQERGNRYQTLAEFLSVFPKQLKVARRIMSL